jgi:hypothetical protein
MEKMVIIVQDMPEIIWERIFLTNYQEFLREILHQKLFDKLFPLHIIRQMKQ